VRCPPISPNPNSPNPISPNRYTLGLGIGLGLGMGLGIRLGPGFDYFRQYNVIRRIGIRRNGAEPLVLIHFIVCTCVRNVRAKTAETSLGLSWD